MDIKRPSHPRSYLLGLLPLLVLVGSSALRASSAEVPSDLIGGRVRVEDPTPARAELVAWAVGRYDAAGLDLPTIDLRFHENAAGCHGNVGWTDGFRVDLCIRLAMDAGPQRLVLHELAHTWCNANLGEDEREAFDRLRGVTSWNGDASEWGVRGTEQAAEIIAWGLGDGTMLPLIGGDVSPAALAAAFEQLTGRAPLHDGTAA
ncbi:MAG TPA: hypothetical protein VH989_05890 [Actinomycetota bacterium]|jgi:hypothetical protein